jgi:hypothetical protein
MDIDGPLRELGAIDTTALREAILSQEEAAWHEDSYRQESYDVHDQTQSIVLVFTDGSNWPESDLRKEPGWDRIADVAVPVMHEIIGKHYPAGGTIIRAMAAKLVVGGIIKPHHDHHPSFHCGHRIHIPITTNSRVRFMIDGRPYQFQVGQAYELNNQKQHSVMNKGTEDRITFIFDYVPPGPLAFVPGKGKGRRESTESAR